MNRRTFLATSIGTAAISKPVIVAFSASTRYPDHYRFILSNGKMIKVLRSGPGFELVTAKYDMIKDVQIGGF